MYIHKLFTPILMSETQKNAQHIEHVCSFILGVFYWYIFANTTDVVKNFAVIKCVSKKSLHFTSF